MSLPTPNKHPGQIILFNFPESVFGRRIVRYLNLRSLLFSQIRVPPNMPRPLLQSRLGINYRRIPIMSIGRDIYIDSRLMLRKLETFFPSGKLGSTSAFEAGIEDILEEFIIDGGPFWRTSGCIPLTNPLVQNEVWMKDRFDGSGGTFTLEALKTNRAWCLSQLRIYFNMIEKLLSDGRDWLMGTKKPGMAEIHAGWVFDWAIGLADYGEDMREALGKEEFPRLHAWVQRFREVTEIAAKANEGGSGIDEGVEAEDEIVKKILESGYTESESLPFDEKDVLELKKSQMVTIAPTDFGFTHKDRGVLVGLSRDEVVIESEVPGGDKGVLRLHYPRINMKIELAEN